MRSEKEIRAHIADLLATIARPCASGTGKKKKCAECQDLDRTTKAVAAALGWALGETGWYDAAVECAAHGVRKL